MCNHYPQARCGTILDIDFISPLAQTVLANNNKAALINFLTSTSKLPECEGLFWGFESNSQTRIVITIGWSNHHHNGGRPAICLSSIRPFLEASRPPRIYDCILSHTDYDKTGSQHPWFHYVHDGSRLLWFFLDTTSPYRIPGETNFPIELPDYMNPRLEEAIDLPTWQEMQYFSRHLEFTIPEPPPEKLSWWEKRTLQRGPKQDASRRWRLKEYVFSLTDPVQRSQCAGHVFFDVVVQKFKVGTRWPSEAKPGFLAVSKGQQIRVEHREKKAYVKMACEFDWIDVEVEGLKPIPGAVLRVTAKAFYRENSI